MLAKRLCSKSRSYIRRNFDKRLAHVIASFGNDDLLVLAVLGESQ